MISVIIPYLKDRGYLNEAIESVVLQTYPYHELLLESGGTQGANINNALKRAKGEYIKILHDDDILPPNSLKDLREGIEGYDWVCGDAESFGEERFCDPQVYEGRVPDFQRMIEENEVYGGTTLYRKEIVRYDEDLWTGEEYDFHLRLLKNGYRCNYIPKVVHNYRLHEFNKSYYMGPGEKKERREFIRCIAEKYR